MCDQSANEGIFYVPVEVSHHCSYRKMQMPFHLAFGLGCALCSYLPV
uniref:Uncharacterized protein n=1 Tax=Anguilla anguilla TaxID=7936 RepID=A0A0E9PWH3_ANGAN